MSVTKLTAYIIATREDVQVAAGGPVGGRWAGWITLGPEDRYRPLLNTEPVYESAQEAKDAMRKTIEEIKKSVEKECGGKHPIDHVFNEVIQVTKPVDTQGFWRRRIEEVMDLHREVHYVIYDIDPGTWQRIQGQTADLVSRMTTQKDEVLDAGCGYGALCDALPSFLRPGYRGIDLSQDLVWLARVRHPTLSDQFAVADLRSLPEVEDKRFDLVVCRSMRDMIVNNLGGDYWIACQRELLRVGKKLLLIEYEGAFTYEVLR